MGDWTIEKVGQYVTDQTLEGLTGGFYEAPTKWEATNTETGEVRTVYGKDADAVGEKLSEGK